MTDALTADVLLADGVQALCEREHDDPCSYPSCICPPMMKSEYASEARAVIAAILPRIAEEVKS